jgi:penicillin-binding protein-related factor A (putative recombinase)
MIDEYLLRPRTADDYCNEVWAIHRSAIVKLAKQTKERESLKLNQLNQRRKGIKFAALPDPVTYQQLLEDFSIHPTR